MPSVNPLPTKSQAGYSSLGQAADRAPGDCLADYFFTQTTGEQQEVLSMEN